MKMNPEIKRRWITALRSGKYPQGKGALHTVFPDSETFCCLGVLCELALNVGVAQSDVDEVRQFGIHTSRTISYFDPDDRNESESSLPTRGVLRWAGLNNIYGACVPKRDEYSGWWPEGVPTGAADLVTLNDAGVPFDKIADLIEREL